MPEQHLTTASPAHNTCIQQHKIPIVPACRHMPRPPRTGFCTAHRRPRAQQHTVPAPQSRTSDSLPHVEGPVAHDHKRHGARAEHRVLQLRRLKLGRPRAPQEGTVVGLLPAECVTVGLACGDSACAGLVCWARRGAVCAGGAVAPATLSGAVHPARGQNMMVDAEETSNQHVRAMLDGLQVLQTVHGPSSRLPLPPSLPSNAAAHTVPQHNELRTAAYSPILR